MNYLHPRTISRIIIINKFLTANIAAVVKLELIVQRYERGYFVVRFVAW